MKSGFLKIVLIVCIVLLSKCRIFCQEYQIDLRKSSLKYILRSDSPHVGSKRHISGITLNPNRTFNDELLALKKKEFVVDIPIDFTNLLISNIVNLDDVNFQKVVLFNNTSFRDSIFFTLSKFSGVSFHRASFSRDAIFDATEFRKEAIFGYSKFEKNISFRNSIFRNGVDFSNAAIKGNAYFTGAVFHKTIDFSGARVEGIADFSNLEISDSTILILKNAELPSVINFSNTNDIPNTIDLTSAHFNYDKNNKDSVCAFYYINLFNSDLKKINIDYEHFRLCFYSETRESFFEFFKNGSDKTKGSENQIAWVTYDIEGRIVKISNAFPFLDSSNNPYDVFTSPNMWIKIGNDNFCLNNRHIVDSLLKNPFFREYISDLFPAITNFSDESFLTTISESVNKLLYGRKIQIDSGAIKYIVECLDKRYFRRSLPEEIKKSIYQKELKNFSDNDRMGSYKKLDIEYKNYINGKNVIPLIWNCYGYHKEWIFYWIIILLVTLTLITFLSLDKLNGILETELFNNYIGEIDKNTINIDNSNAVYPIYKIPTLPKLKWTFSKEGIREMIRRFWYSLMYTASIFFLLTLKVENINFKRIGVLYVLIIYSLGIVCLGYLANFILQK